MSKSFETFAYFCPSEFTNPSNFNFPTEECQMPCTLSWIWQVLWSGEWEKTAQFLYERDNKLHIFLKNRVDLIVLFPKTPLLSSKTSRKRSHLVHIHHLVFDFFSLQPEPCFFLRLMDFLYVIFAFENFTIETVYFVFVWKVKVKTVERFSFPNET